MVAPSIADAIEALKELNPENLDDLIILKICDIRTYQDLLKLRVNPKVKLPNIILENIRDKEKINKRTETKTLPRKAKKTS